MSQARIVRARLSSFVSSAAVAAGGFIYLELTMGAWSIWHWIVLLVVVVLVFGTKRLRNAGGDLGAFIKGFRKGLNDDEPAARLEADPKDTASTASKNETREKQS